MREFVATRDFVGNGYYSTILKTFLAVTKGTRKPSEIRLSPLALARLRERLVFGGATSVETVLGADLVEDEQLANNVIEFVNNNHPDSDILNARLSIELPDALPAMPDRTSERDVEVNREQFAFLLDRVGWDALRAINNETISLFTPLGEKLNFKMEGSVQ